MNIFNKPQVSYSENRIILMYHDVYDTHISESGFQNATAIPYKISAEVFEAHVQHICQLWKNLSKEVVFSFDDGGISFLKTIAPILEKYGFRGLFFVSTAYIGKPGFLNEDDIRQLEKRGHTIGSHSHSHPERMSSLTAQQLSEEWEMSQTYLSRILSHKVRHASIPNGYASDTVYQSMSSAGYVEIYDSRPVSHVRRKAGVYTLYGRYAIKSSFDINEVLAIVSNPLKRFLLATRFQILAVLKKCLGRFYLKIRKLFAERIRS